jgi:hypothetical protein
MCIQTAGARGACFGDAVSYFEIIFVSFNDFGVS